MKYQDNQNYFRALVLKLLAAFIAILLGFSVFAVSAKAADKEASEDSKTIESQNMPPAAFADKAADLTADSDSDSFDLPIKVLFCQSEARTELDMINELRTGDDAWYWNSDNSEKLYFTDLKELTYDYDLEKVAMQRAVEIAVYYSHTRPDGYSCWQTYEDFGYRWNAVGENIAAGFRSASAVFTAWAEEDDDYSGQGHRRNMLSGSFTAVGCACVYYEGYYYWVQEFSRPINNDTPTPANDDYSIESALVGLDYAGTWTLSTDTINIDSDDPHSILEDLLMRYRLTIAGWSPQATVRTSMKVLDWVPEDKTIVKFEDGIITGLKGGTTTMSALPPGSDTPLTVTVNVTQVHKWGTPTYTWSDDLSKVTAEAKCTDCDEVITETVKTKYSISKEPGCEDEGLGIYTAEFTKAAFETQTKEVAIKATGHDYSLSVWDWADDYSSAYALFICKKDSTHTVKEKADITTVTEDPTCEKAGSTTYTAKVTFEGKEYTSVKTVTLDALGHSYGKPEYIWSKSYTDATAKAVCERCKDEIKETVKSKYEVIKEPTCEEKGTGKYTAEFKNELFETQTVELDISALGHDYQLTEWKWSEDDTQAWAVFTCQNDKSHVQTIEAEVESDGIYATATVVFEDKTYTTRKKIGEILPKSIILNIQVAEIPTESTLQLKATIEPSDADNKKIIWTSSDEEIATVDQNGKVTALRYGKVTITATAEADNTVFDTCEIQTRFYDVNDSKKYYYEPVYWAADNEITTGYDRVYFGPQKNCTRQELAIFLWRLAGKPEVSGELPFSDTKYDESSASFQAILWCSQQGIVRGYNDGTFKPKANIERKDAMIMLYRLAGKPDVEGEIKFPDVVKMNLSKTSDTYKAILWGVNNGITNGYKDGNFQPKTKCLREHIVTFIHRADKVINN